ncbi:MAG: DNA-processing protein DprA [candidate division Zixibacteria bacterium]|nr:DNA-processing protein DprA [candidate division Zixibacteria bacterium]
MEELELIIASGTIPISTLDPRYPQRLFRLPDPPTILYVRGTLPDEAKTAVAVVGTHQADAEGIADGVAWGKGLAQRDAIVVSGLARGIDGAAHVGALAASGTTVAVLGGGFDNIYPPEHATLAAEIAKTGALLSEYPPRAPLTKPRLIARNRIIVGLSDAVVVVRLHADARGSMEAIHKAGDLAIPVFLVATDVGPKSQEAVADGAVPIGQAPDFDLVLNYL